MADFVAWKAPGFVAVVGRRGRGRGLWEQYSCVTGAEDGK